MTPKGKVYLIGAGPGDVDLLTLRALKMLQSADAVVYDRLVSPEILGLAPETARMIPVGKAPKCHPVTQTRINQILVDLAEEGLTVARLKGGDPLIFGRGSEEAGYLASFGVPVDYAPGITAAQGMAATTGIPLTHRGLATGVRYVTGHRAADRSLDLDWTSLADTDTTLVIYMGAATISGIALCLIREGMPGSTPVLAISSATTPRERRLVSRLDQIGVDIKAMPLRAPVLFVIGRVVSLYREHAVSEPEALPPLAVEAGE